MIKRFFALCKRVTDNKNTIDDLLLFTFLFGAVLLVIRVGISGRLSFVFLVWNLFLALLPYMISSSLQKREHWVENKFIFTFFFLLWLSLVPNSFYILTDLFHLEVRKPIPLWYDLLLIFSFAWNGLLFGILSVRQMEQMISVHIKRTSLFLFPVLLLNGIGVYIGRYLRYNTWDIITNPFELFGDLVSLTVHPFRHFYAWSMIIVFSFFLLLLYITLKKISFTNK